MPAASMDALGAFSYLSDNLPSWMAQLSDVTAHTAAKHAEFAEAFRKHSSNIPRPRRRRNSSVCSIQTSSRPPLAGSVASSQRCKRAANDLSSLDSGNRPALLSTRYNLIIHYDSHTQKSLEELVRHIGTARNNLRKGKMAQLPMMNFGSRAMNRRAAPAGPPTLGSEGSEDLLLSNIRSARTRGMAPPKNQSQRQESPFNIADKQLELAHSLCETAAYHFLRAGDCAQELRSVKDKFSLLLDLATHEVERLKQEQKENILEDEEPEPPQTVETSSLKRPASSEGAIEVDDDDASVESIDLTAFRRMRR